MHRIDSPGSVAGQWVNGNPILGVPGTVIDNGWMNAVQEELSGMVEGEGIVLSRPVLTQLRTAILAAIARVTGAEISFTAGGTLTAGQGLLLGDTFGVVKTSATIGLPTALYVLGTFTLPKAALAVSQFVQLYWDNGAGKVTTVSAGNRSIGIAAAAALLADPTMSVRLKGAPNL